MTLPLFERARRYADRTAIVAPEGEFSYGELSAAAESVATHLLDGRPDLGGERVCFLVPSGWSYAAVQWGIWRAGGVAVPMAVSHPTAELEHVLDDAGPTTVVAHPELASRLSDAATTRRLRLIDTQELTRSSSGGTLPTLAPERPCMILYTSGTTGRPKGAVLSHGNVQAQVESLSQAWGWTPDDRVLLHLPLHHVHGIVNVLTSALWNGAVCDILPTFRPLDVWERLASGGLTLYMAVPTVYARLIDAWDEAAPEKRSAWSLGARPCRLMISGSAALPVPTLERWEAITGHRLLERYGMTEIGMALSNPVTGERRPGYVGEPLPGVQVRLVDEADQPVPVGTPGQIQVRGPTVFGSYLGRPEETAAAFTPDGWFRTGDVAVIDQGAYRILGRSSVDILKTGGEKISALEIEDVLRAHGAVADCAVVGVPDPEWGERVCAAVVRRPASEVSEAELRTFAKSRLAPYKVPKQFLFVAELPRNPMGKVTKPAVREIFQSDTP
ncbi:MAG: long-chain fatty acid--CoA ligase [Gemmatimonadetes bacterium]|nr:long-chain fatty acid--CoA ligase [Gemmatimonadota bacterium]